MFYYTCITVYYKITIHFCEIQEVHILNMVTCNLVDFRRHRNIYLKCIRKYFPYIFSSYEPDLRVSTTNLENTMVNIYR